MRTNASLLLLLGGFAGGCDRQEGEVRRHTSALAEAEVERDDAELLAEEPGTFAVSSVRAEVFEPPDAVRADLDGDGFVAEMDPDDEDPFTHPGARDEPCDGVDQDRDGVEYCPPDADGDGVRANADCDDADPTRSPLVLEEACNGADENCNGYDDCDSDGDGAMDHYDLDPRDPAVSVPPIEEDVERP